MAALRIRKTFRYPEDSDDDARQELDEEEQERIINDLRSRDDARNAEYKLVFTIVPLVSIVAFLPGLFSSSATASERIISFLSTLSLLASAYIMRHIPLPRPDPKGKRPVRNLGYLELVREHLVAVNVGLCALVTLLAYATGYGYGISYAGVPRLSYLVPGVVFGIICITRKLMLSVDVGQLENLKYDYKGA
ncbi:hypothetical protein DTO166G4_639 [Paecilomyces variotii]|nr:hypothetical protein DTO166G4_639 [Paecilomyces variotii]KAJ9238897.1 hypothetical protein DTO166G5_2693 [Paecilomyces variotii]KAJ9243822.1 hypothetical protein DTO169E5_2451 [Paecilomyces variotii]KAJ9260655.1 hypothetical protein DTO195F2_4495 [Paecilomyces variotii]KAJ9408538.1 hypothetical protein DTO045G8_3831 [Paecilomyces variotii]